jgi:hypothetical protein
MKTKNIQIQPDRRCSAKNLEKILSELPIEINGPSLHLTAHMGPGKIIYMESLYGYIRKVVIKDDKVVREKDWCSEDSVGLNYNGQRYEIKTG